MYKRQVLYTVKFLDHDGKILKTQEVESGKSATAPTAPTREGYTFTGWEKIFTNVTKDLTITAQYEVIKFTVNFVDYDNTVLKTEVVVSGASATAPADPIREGYTFIGWDKDFDSIENDITITATYDTNKYTITFDSAGGSPIPSIKQDYNTTITPPADPIREGYTFKGWNPIIPATMPAENINITAQWEINKYTITFETDGGSNINIQKMCIRDRLLIALGGAITTIFYRKKRIEN